MPRTKTHNRAFFYKHFTYDGAKKTLENGTFLYRAPEYFNDPFDSQLTLQPGITEEQFNHLVFESVMHAIVENRPEPRVGLTPEILAGLPRNLNKEGLFQIKDILLKAVPKNHFIESHRRAAELQKEFFRDNFVFCVTEEFDNLLMWSHYSEEHKGVVLKIKCIEERESLLCAALEVNYRDSYPSFGDLDGWKKFLESGKIADPTKAYNELITTKSTHWQYEKEWRMVFPRPEDRGKKCTFLKFHPEEIECIFLGCRMEESNKAIILEIAKKLYPSAQVFQARKSETAFQLHFDKLAF